MIANAITNAFTDSARRVISTGRSGVAKEAIVHFDNSFTREDFNDKYSHEVSNVLYLNDVAKSIIETSGIVLSLNGVIEEVPNTAGLMSRVPCYDNI
jgi:hypothetical protein